ncbi:MOSC domain-containing protein [Endozoicomonas sp. OPT23]|uniref:MOSC domain-containing protein n=1 Tax=Endozoicomonas sp. OPT23 TaxID=2072845 RepID=UPI00129BDCCA|nr:MOSC domain-containing protein [Endozoicomonas sp. OPT23]MRI34152.1 MOSC domain-containing protein [Endozoicomonas sp. OPT23]
MPDRHLTISDLIIYPIKSTKAIHLQQAEVEQRGFSHDRRWMLIDSDGQFLSQRKHPAMALINCQLTNSGITISAPKKAELEISTPDHNALSISGTVWGDDCQALDAGEQAAQWFSDYIGFECRLIYMPDSTQRQVDTRFTQQGDITGFADGFPFLLTTEASLKELNSRLEQPVNMLNFRPNIVIKGAGAYDEDNWKRIRLGGVIFNIAKPCSRCVMTTVDPETGTKQGKDPLATLAKYRRTEHGVIFGQNLIQENNGIIRLGDEVEILE